MLAVQVLLVVLGAVAVHEANGKTSAVAGAVGLIAGFAAVAWNLWGPPFHLDRFMVLVGFVAVLASITARFVERTENNPRSR